MQIVSLFRTDYGLIQDFTITGFDGNPINVSGSTVRFKFGIVGTGSFPVFDKECSIVDAALGIVRLTYQGSDLSGSSGRYYGELAVTSVSRQFHIRDYVVYLNDVFPTGSS